MRLAIYLKPSASVTVAPPGSVTTTSACPTVPAGVVAVMVVLFTTVNAVDNTVSGAIRHFSEYVVGSQEPVATLTIWPGARPTIGEYTLLEDGGFYLETLVYLLDAAGKPILGRTVTVTLSNPDVLQLLQGQDFDAITNVGCDNNGTGCFALLARSTGTTIVTVSSEGISSSFTVHVVARSRELGGAALDFSPTMNPNGPWSAGYTTALGSPLKLYQRPLETNGLQYWLDPVNNSLNTPGYYKNVSDGIVYGSTPGQVSLHPGCNGHEYSVLRWRAPAVGRYAVQAQFFIGDQQGIYYGETTAHILVNSVASSPLFYAPRTSLQPTF